MKYETRCYGQLKHAFSQKAISQASRLYTYGCFSVYRHNVSPPLSFSTVFANFWAAYLQEHDSILRNTIVYRDITIYCNNVKTLRFLTFCFCNALRSVTREPSNRSLPFFHGCTIKHRYTMFWSHLHFLKCRMSRVFAQSVIYYIN